MATSAQIPVETYLHTSYRPDREYIDGEVRERNVGKSEHARLQALLAAWFQAQEQSWGVMVATEQRIQVTASRVRIPDVVLVKLGQQPDVLIVPPILVVEILSADDTYSDTEERATDYRAMGVDTIWIIDPLTRTGRMCIGDTWSAGMRLEVPGTAIHVELSSLFSRLNESKTQA